MKILNPHFFITVAILASCGGADIQPQVGIEDAAVSEPNQIKPHIVFILLDDLGVDAGPCSNDLSLMTNLEFRCGRSLVFENAYAYPSCTPSRAALMTGRASFRHGANDVQLNSTKLQLSETTIPEAIKLLGSDYTSAAFGKWHLADNDNGGVDSPNLQGFDHYEGNPRQTGTYVYPAGKYEWFVNGHSAGLSGKYKTTQIADSAINYFLENHDNGPLYSHIAFVNPHLPFHLPPMDLHSYNLPDPSTVLPANVNSTHERQPLVDPYYFAMLEAADNEINRLVDEFTIASNRPILFIVMGDNGSAEQVTQIDMNGLYRTKSSTYQGGIRVPLMMWSSDNSRFSVDAGSYGENVIINDLFPTLVDIMTDKKPPESDGVSLRSVIENNSLSLKRPYIYVEGGHLRRQPFEYTAIREDGLKLTLSEADRGPRRYRDNFIELYDITSDKTEMSDISTDCKHVSDVDEIFEYIVNFRKSQDEISGGDKFNEPFYRQIISELKESCE